VTFLTVTPIVSHATLCWKSGSVAELHNHSSQGAVWFRTWLGIAKLLRMPMAGIATSLTTLITVSTYSLHKDLY
jgi:hypothetical protein